MNTRVSKKAAPTRAVVNGGEKGAKEAATRADVIKLFPATAYSGVAGSTSLIRRVGEYKDDEPKKGPGRGECI